MTLPEFLDRLHRADLAPLRRDLLRGLVLVAEAEAKRRVPVRTGTLRRSITGQVRDDLHGVIGSNVTYAAFVERGTKYQAARPYLAPGVAAAKAALPALWQQVATRWIRGLVG